MRCVMFSNISIFRYSVFNDILSEITQKLSTVKGNKITYWQNETKNCRGYCVYAKRGPLQNCWQAHVPSVENQDPSVLLGT